MLIQHLVGVLLTINVSTTVTVPPDVPSGHEAVQHRNTAVQPTVSAATNCIMRAVGADPRLTHQTTPEGLGDLIVDAVPSCMFEVRAMIDAYDRKYGQGSGETFFLGPYLDVLPTAVGKAVMGTPR